MGSRRSPGSCGCRPRRGGCCRLGAGQLCSSTRSGRGTGEHRTVSAGYPGLRRRWVRPNWRRNMPRCNDMSVRSRRCPTSRATRPSSVRISSSISSARSRSSSSRSRWAVERRTELNPDRSSLGQEFFDDFYGDQPDPWGFESRWYERRKRAITMASLPRETFRRAFEPGCSIGVLTAELATRCRRGCWRPTSRSVRWSPPAARLSGIPGVRFEQRRIPDEWPSGAVRPGRPVRGRVLLRAERSPDVSPIAPPRR